MNKLSSSAKLPTEDEMISFWEVILSGYKPVSSTNLFVVFDLISNDYQILVAAANSKTPVISPIVKANRSGTSFSFCLLAALLNQTKLFEARDSDDYSLSTALFEALVPVLFWFFFFLTYKNTFF